VSLKEITFWGDEFKFSICCYSVSCESQWKVILKSFGMEHPLWFGICCVADEINTTELFFTCVTGDKQEDFHRLREIFTL